MEVALNLFKTKTMVSRRLVEVDVDVECTADLEEMCAVVDSVGSEVVNAVGSAVVTAGSGEVSEVVTVVGSAVEVTAIGEEERVVVEDEVVVEVSVFLLAPLIHIFSQAILQLPTNLAVLRQHDMCFLGLLSCRQLSSLQR